MHDMKVLVWGSVQKGRENKALKHSDMSLRGGMKKEDP